MTDVLVGRMTSGADQRLHLAKEARLASRFSKMHSRTKSAPSRRLGQIRRRGDERGGAVHVVRRTHAPLGDEGQVVADTVFDAPE